MWIIAGMSELPGKLEALKQRCAEVGRDANTLETSVLLSVILGETVRGDDIPEALRNRSIAGSPDAVAEQVRSRVLDVGVDGVIINLPIQGHEPGVDHGWGSAETADRGLIGRAVGRARWWQTPQRSARRGRVARLL